MSDAFGSLIVSFSEDYVGSKPALCAALNAIACTGWCSGKGKFVENAGNIIFKHDLYSARNPTVYIEHLVGYSRYEDGKVVQFVSIEDVKERGDESFKNWEPELDLVYLPEICRILSKHITTGSFSLTACASEKSLYHYFEMLVVNSDGSGERLMHKAATGVVPLNIIENC